jgi:hypothetical protein
MAIALFDANVTKSLFMFPQKQNKTLKQGSNSFVTSISALKRLYFFSLKKK